MLSTFTNQLPVEIQLSGEWVVAISEIYINKLETNSCRRVRQTKQIELINAIQHYLSTLPESARNSPRYMLANKRLKEEQNAHADHLIQRQEAYEQTEEDKNFWGDIEHAHSKHLAEQKKNTSKNCVTEKDESLNFMFLYADIIKSRIVGDYYYQCLKVIPVKGEEQVITFSNLEYYPLQKNVFDSISISLQDDVGDKIDFQSSTKPTMVTLHFKRLH